MTNYSQLDYKLLFIADAIYVTVFSAVNDRIHAKMCFLLCKRKLARLILVEFKKSLRVTHLVCCTNRISFFQKWFILVQIKTSNSLANKTRQQKGFWWRFLTPVTAVSFFSTESQQSNVSTKRAKKVIKFCERKQLPIHLSENAPINLIFAHTGKKNIIERF